MGKRASTCPVSSYPASRSKHGVDDLAGNVWEWTSSRWEADAGMQVVRGGSWNYINPDAPRAAHRLRHEPARRFHNLGFRCARTLPTAPRSSGGYLAPEPLGL